MDSLRLVESLPEEDSHTHFLAVLKNLGSFYMQLKKFDLSASLYEKAHEVAMKVSWCTVVEFYNCSLLQILSRN